MGRIFGLMVAMALLAGSAHAAGGLFGLVEIRASNISAIPKWVNLVGRVHAQEGIYRNCFANREACSGDGMLRWASMMDEELGKGRKHQLNAVHDFMNHYPYITDNRLWGKSDYWETPREFVEDSGDCEDYAIAKYWSLKLLGWPVDTLRMAVVQDTVRDIPHAILIAQMDGDYWVLDNLATDPLPHEQVFQYRPYYAVNEKNRWVFVRPLGSQDSD